MSEVADFTEQFDRCLMNEPAFCGAACPFGLDVRSFIKKIKQNRLSAAFQQYRDTVVFPAIVSKICDRPCESVCPLSGIDRAIDLRGLEEFVTSAYEYKEQESYNLPRKGKKIAVVGAGLSGLACALKLTQKKYDVEVFEAAGKIDETISSEIDLRFKNEEWTLKTGCRIESLDGLIETGYDAVYIATGERGNAFGLNDSVFGQCGPSEECLPAKTVPHTGAFEKFHSNRGGLHDLTADAGVCIIAGGALTGACDTYAIADGITAAAAIEAFFKTGILNTARPSDKTEMVLAPIHLERYKQNKNTAYENEAERCLVCRCDACMVYCDLPAYTVKWPPRIRDEVFATTLPGKAEVKATPAKRLINMDNLSGVFKDVCPVGIDMDGLLLAGRQSMHRQEKMPWAFHEFWLRDMEHANGETASLVIAKDVHDIANNESVIVNNESVIASEAKQSKAFAFFPGCQLGAASPALVQAAWDELLSLNDSVDTMPGHLAGLILKCCGAPVLWAGDEKLFEEVLVTIKKDWESLGKPTLVCACPSCMRIIDTYMPEIETISLYEVLPGTTAEKHSCSNMDCRAAEAALYDRISINDTEAARYDGRSTNERRNTPDDKRPWAVFDACAAARLPDGKKSDRLRNSVRMSAEAMGIKLLPLPIQENVPRCCGFGGQSELANPDFIKRVREDRTAESDLPFLCYCMNCREAFLKAGKESSHILELRYQKTGYESMRSPELSPSLRRVNRESLRSGLLRDARNDRADARNDSPSGFDLLFADGVIAKMDKNLILEDDVFAVIEHSIKTGEYVIYKETGLLSGTLVIGRTTYWVRFAEEKTAEKPVFTVFSAYTHRLAIEREAVWTDPRGDSGMVSANDAGESGMVSANDAGGSGTVSANDAGGSGFYCAKHDAELIETEAEFSYLGRFFKHNVLRCPVCGYVYITEELAGGRMREVEMALEDK